MFSPICFTNFFHKFFSVRAVEKENKLLIGSKQVFFSQFDSWKRNHNKYWLKHFVYLEFEIGESIWWTTPWSEESKKIFTGFKSRWIMPWLKVIYTKYSKHWPYTVAHTIKCVCHSIRSMFRVLGIYNFALR